MKIKAGTKRASQSNKGQDRTGHDNAGQGWAKQGKEEKNRTGQDQGKKKNRTSWHDIAGYGYIA